MLALIIPLARDGSFPDRCPIIGRDKSVAAAFVASWTARGKPAGHGRKARRNKGRPQQRGRPSERRGPCAAACL